MRFAFASFLAGLVLSFSPTAGAQEKALAGKQVDMHWGDLSMFLAGGKIKLPLPDGAVVEGETLSVTPNEMVVLVSKSSDAKLHPKGRQTFARASVKTIQLTRIKGAGGRVGFTILGISAGLAAGSVIAVYSDDSGASGVARLALALPVAGGVAGYFGGRAFDRRTTLIRVLPD